MEMAGSRIRVGRSVAGRNEENKWVKFLNISDSPVWLHMGLPSTVTSNDNRYQRFIGRLESGEK